MTNQTELKIVGLSHTQIKELWPVLLNRDRRKELTQLLREQGECSIFANDQEPVYEQGVKRAVLICHMLGYTTPRWMCDNLPDVDERKGKCREIMESVLRLSMEHGGIVWDIHDFEDDDSDFEEFSIFEFEYPTEADAETASQLVVDMWSEFGVRVRDDDGRTIGESETPTSQFISELPSAARTNKAPERRVPARLVRSYANLSDEKENTLSRIAEIRETKNGADLDKSKAEIELWYCQRDIVFSMASIAWHECGLPFNPTNEQLDEWLGGNKLHAIDP